MKRLVLSVVALIVAVMFCAPLYAQGAAQGSADNGKKVYEREKCSMCHTATRNSLADVGTKLTAEQIRLWIVNPAEAAKTANPKPKMAMKKYTLQEKDVNDLVAYLQTMKGGK